MWTSTHLHDARSGDFIVIFVGAIVWHLAVLLLPIGTALALESLWLQGFFCDSLLAGAAFGNITLFDFTKDRVAVDLELAFHTSSSCKGSMTLNHLLGQYPGISFNVVNVLGVIGQQLSLVLKQSNESMGRGPLLFRGKDVLRDGEEDAGILPENLNIKDFLRVTETQMFQLRVETGIFRSEVGNA